MKQLLFIIMLFFTMAGCTTFKQMQASVFDHDADASQKLASARQEIEQGRQSAATTTLEKLVAEPGVKGITDEALFRLSLLKLQTEEKDGSLPAIRYLERLRHDYRDSIWSQQAKPLLDSLYQVVELKKQIRNLKNLNNSLSKDNKELRQSIERLKNLDMQLERKAR